MKSTLKQIQLRLVLLQASLVYMFKVETAYALNNILSVVGTLVFGISQVVFANIVFFNIDTLGGLNKDQMLLFFLLSQYNFVINDSFLSRNLYGLVNSVNNGNLDLVLIRPLPSLFYVSTKELSIINFIRSAVVGAAIYYFIIDWSNVGLGPINFVFGLIVMFIGIYLLYFFQFLTAIPVFISGQSGNLLDFSYVFDYRLGRMVPFDALSKPLKVFFSSVIPVLVGTGITISVMIGNSDPIEVLQFLIPVTLIAILVQNLIWRKMLRIYTSASS